MKYCTAHNSNRLRRFAALLLVSGLLFALGACSNPPMTLEPTTKKPKFIMEDPLPSSPGERTVTYFGKPEKRELAKLHLGYGENSDESGITFDINKHKRSIMAETPIAGSEKTSTIFSFGAHKDHRFLAGITFKIRF